ncbi:TIGR03752 family integrating conjugative element protein [Pseudomonas putida]|uniref:TIGR03752 family integrating conjugative element protein n=1 Tax=Pseudomonas putida TaxID=303 RepID=A0A7Y7Z7I8_PSEPU|nr:TIGR03752 family integrating conjugative element protein [Pseudomonas putida]NWC79227.1 TIGR03752 family integrating conjugative element protein [Pseudomonas putida]QPN43657.1 TIGR03752 family integrating conjugative element protein [Priestia aryabhattai]
MKANSLLKWLVPGVLLGIVMIIVKSWVATPDGQPAHDPENTTLSAEQAKALGIAGDTPRDTVATLIGQVKAMRSEMLTLKKGNDALQTENSRLRTREGNIDTRIQSTLSSVTQQVTEQRQQANDARQKAEQQHRETQGLLSRLKDQVTGKPAAKSDVPAGFGLEPGDEQQFAGAPAPADAVQWIEPSNARAGQEDTSKGDGPLPSLTSKLKDLHGLDNNAIDRGQDRLRAVAKGERDLENAQDRTEGARPVYTIPENSTLMGSIAMTALIGRVPVDGTVNDPYPFKVLVGPDNLTANGIDLPDVVGAVMSGTAAGDWTLSCVRGQVESITFVFSDGTVRTVPQPQKVVSRNRSSTQTSDTEKIRGGLGYISDPYGIPCISGERRSNAQQYLGSQSLITAAGAGFAAALGSEQTNTSFINSASGSLGLSQNSGNSALNSVISGGIGDIREWINKLYGEAFAAIYVPPGARVALHLDHEISIDYEPKGRRVNHESPSVSVLDLD